MFTADISFQIKMLPAGYERITDGKLRPGDLRWNCWHDEWNQLDVTTSPKHDCVIGDPVSSFPGVARPIS
jgi:hypothetical protein